MWIGSGLEVAVAKRWLVGGEWLPSILYFPINIGNVIIPIDEIIFFRGVAQPPTRYGKVLGFPLAIFDQG